MALCGNHASEHGQAPGQGLIVDHSNSSPKKMAAAAMRTIAVVTPEAAVP